MHRHLCGAAADPRVFGKKKLDPQQKEAKTLSAVCQLDEAVSAAGGVPTRPSLGGCTSDVHVR